MNEGHRLRFGHLCSVEVEWVLRVAERYGVFALGSAELVIVDEVVLVGVGEFLSFFRHGVGAVVEAVTVPGSIGELAPEYVVRKEFFGLCVHHEDFGPV